MPYGHLYDNHQRKQMRLQRKHSRLSSITSVKVAGYETGFEPSRDIAGLRVKGFTGPKGKSGLGLSIFN